MKIICRRCNLLTLLKTLFGFCCVQKYPGEHQADFLFDLIGGVYGELEFDDSIISPRSGARFLRGIIMSADLNTWSHGIVGPHNFGAKWFGGRARPEVRL